MPSYVRAGIRKCARIRALSAEQYLIDNKLARFDTMIPFKEGLRRASDTGQFPSATGYGMVAKEILEVFAE